MRDLLGGQSTHPAHELVILRVVRDEIQRGERCVLLAHRVVGEKHGQVVGGELGPRPRCPGE